MYILHTDIKSLIFILVSFTISALSTCIVLPSMYFVLYLYFQTEIRPDGILGQRFIKASSLTTPWLTFVGTKLFTVLADTSESSAITGLVTAINRSE